MNDDNKYLVVDQIDQGGQATINKVIHKEYGYIRALRQLHGIQTINDKNDPVYLKFVDECKILLRIGNGSHPNIIKISQPLLFRGTPAVEMELLLGLDVYKDLAKNKGYYTSEKIIRLLKDISSALSYCHVDLYKYCMNPFQDSSVSHDGKELIVKEKEKGEEKELNKLIEKYKVIHNDIQSKNIFLNEDGRFILLDFGLSFEGGNVVRTTHKHGVDVYKAPEKFDKDYFTPTEQSDIYSFGILLYECLTGEVPFPDKEGLTISKKKELEDKLKRINELKIPDIWTNRKVLLQKLNLNSEKKDYPDWLEKIILKCLEIDPNERFQNGKELHEEVKKCLSEENENKSFNQELYDYKKLIANYDLLLNDSKRKIIELEKQVSSINKDTEVNQEKASIRLARVEREKIILEKEVEKLNKGIEELNTFYEISQNKIEDLSKQIDSSNLAAQKTKTLIIQDAKIESDKLYEQAKEKALEEYDKLMESAREQLELEKESMLNSIQIDEDNYIRTIANLKNEIKSNADTFIQFKKEISEGKKDLKVKEEELFQEKNNVKVVLSDKAVAELENAKKKYTKKFIAGVAISLLLSSGGTWFLMDQKKENTSNEQEATAAVDSTLYTKINPIDSIETKIEENTVRVISYQEALDKVNNIQNIFDNGNLPNTNEIKEITKIYPDLLNKVEDIFNNKISILKNGGVPYGEYENRLMEIKKSGKKNRIPRKI